MLGGEAIWRLPTSSSTTTPPGGRPRHCLKCRHSQIQISPVSLHNSRRKSTGRCSVPQIIDPTHYICLWQLAMLAFADTDGVCGFAASLVRGRHQSLVWHGQASRGDTHWEMAYYQYHGVTVHKLMLGARKQFQNTDY